MTTSDEIFADASRSAGDLAGVFEFDGETAYFYLYRVGEEQKVLDAIHVLSAKPDFGKEDIAIRWTLIEDKVGLFIRGELWAVFDTHNKTKYGGNYRKDLTSTVPPVVSRAFSLS